MKGRADQVFGDIGAVRIGCVDEVDPQFGQPLERAQTCLAIGRLAPDAFAGDAHGAEAEAVDGDLTAYFKTAGFAGVRMCHGRLLRLGVLCNRDRGARFVPAPAGQPGAGGGSWHQEGMRCVIDKGRNRTI